MIPVHHPQRRALLLLAAFAVALPAAACSIESRTGLVNPEDVEVYRDRALAVYPNQTTDDRIDSGEGDTVDWKFVDVREPGTLKVQVTIDSPNTVGGRLVLRDNFATVVEKMEITTDRTVYTFSPVLATVKGRYYLQFECFGGATVYTVATEFDPLQIATPTVAVRNSFERIGPDPAPPRRWRARPKKKTEEKKADPKTDTPVATKEGPKPVDKLPDDPNMIEVVGSILRVTPLDGGGASVVISLQGEKNDRVNPNDRGLITGIKKGVVVRDRSGNVVTAFTEAQADTIKAQKTVIFRVK